MFWLNDFSVLYHHEKLLDFFPLQTDSYEERLNSLVRLAFYTSVSLYAYKSNPGYFYILGAAFVLTYLMYTVYPEQLENLQESHNGKTLPTLDNPFMNATMGDYLDTNENGRINDKSSAADILDPTVKAEVDVNFYSGSNVVRDVNDFFNRQSSEREFVSMPSTSVPHNREDFQNWLYKAPDTCKEDSNCLRYEDVRQKRPQFPDKFTNPSKIEK